jgi:hypothetical protein
LKINKHCYLLHLVGLDFITLPTLKMHGQTQIKFTQLIPAAILHGTSKRATQQLALFNVYSAGQEFVHFYGNRRVNAVHSGSCSDDSGGGGGGDGDGDGDGDDDDDNNKRITLECAKR